MVILSVAYYLRVQAAFKIKLRDFGFLAYEPASYAMRCLQDVEMSSEEVQEEEGQLWCEEELLLHSIFNGFSHLPQPAKHDTTSCGKLASIVSHFTDQLQASALLHNNMLLAHWLFAPD